MRYSLVLTAVLCLLQMPARAEVLQIHVPGLIGTYPVGPGNYTRSVTITLPKLPDQIHGASFWIYGGGTVGVVDCGNPGQADVWPMEYIAEMQDGEGGAWIAYHEPNYVPGQFIRAAAFEQFSGMEDWDFRMDGEAELVLSGAPSSAMSGCDPIVAPTGSIFDAYFFLDADFPVAVEATTWGRIKALYR